jgi:hypothetical protein
MKVKKIKRKVIYSLEDIPDHFESEDEEREWWADHEFSEELLNSMEDTTAELDKIAPLPDGPRPLKTRP